MASHENPFRESAAHYKQIGWSFVAAVTVMLIAGFAVFATGPESTMRPTRVQPTLAADTANMDTLIVSARPGSR